MKIRRFGLLSLAAIALASPSLAADSGHGVLRIHVESIRTGATAAVDDVPVLSAIGLRETVVGRSVSIVPEVTNGAPVDVWAISPPLPVGSGLSFDGVTGAILGTAVTTGDYGPFTISATNGQGEATTTARLSVYDTLAAADVEDLHINVGERVNFRVLPSGGKAPYSINLNAVESPGWLQLAADGTVAGTAEAGEWMGLTFQIADAGLQNISRSFDLVVEAALSNVYGWGYNLGGSLGNGTVTQTRVPTPAPELVGMTEISIGTNHGCGIKSGKAWCWGNNSQGQLGNGATANSLTPVAVVNSDGFTNVVAGSEYSCALKGASVYCWGSNGTGGLGNNSALSAKALTPITVTDANNYKSLSAQTHICGVKTDDTISCWGNNYYGQAGKSTATAITTPTQISDVLFSKVKTLSSSTCGLSTSGDIYCWGTNGNGNFGNGTTLSGARGSINKASDAGYSDLMAAGASVCGLKADGWYCWGANGSSQLGIGYAPDRLSPVKSLHFNDATSVGMGALFGCGLKGGDAYCWGGGNEGQIGYDGVRDFNGMTKVSGTQKFGRIDVQGAQTVGYSN